MTLADPKFISLTAIQVGKKIMFLGRRNATTGGSGNTLASVSLFSISFQ
jgi:hypothetical protein